MPVVLVSGLVSAERAFDDDFEALLIEQTAALTAYACRLRGGGADADDLLQDTLLRCWMARHSFQFGTSIAA